MAFEKRDNSGTLFKNAKKEKETHPDYNGDVTVNGESYWISGWLKKDRNGNTFMSLSFKPKQQSSGIGKPGYAGASKPIGQKVDNAGRVARPSLSEQLDDEVPF